MQLYLHYVANKGQSDYSHPIRQFVNHSRPQIHVEKYTKSQVIYRLNITWTEYFVHMYQKNFFKGRMLPEWYVGYFFAASRNIANLFWLSMYFDT